MRKFVRGVRLKQRWFVALLAGLWRSVQQAPKKVCAVKFNLSASTLAALLGLIMGFTMLLPMGRAEAASPPNESVSFDASGVVAGQVFGATVVLSNPNTSTALTGIADVFSLTNGANFASSPNLSNGCGGSVSVDSGTSFLTISGVTLAAEATCSITFNVVFPQAAFYSLGSRNNGATASETGGNHGTKGYASMTASNPLTTTQAIGSTSLYQGVALGSALVPVTADGGYGTVSFGISSSLPSGLSFNTANGAITGTPTDTSEATIYTVTATDHANPAHTSSKTFQLTVAQVFAPTITAAFGPTSVIVCASSTLTLTVSNPNGTTVLTGVSIASQALPSSLTGSNPATTCSGGTATLASGAISMSGATLAAHATCTVTLNVASIVPGNYSYTSGVASASGPSSLTGTTATTPTPLTVNAPLAPTISAAFSQTSMMSGTPSTLTLTLSNPNATTQLTGVAITSSALPDNLSGSTPHTTCTGGTATFAGGMLSLSGAVLNASASCTVTLSVDSVVSGTYSYTTGVASASGPASVTGTTADTPTPLTVSTPPPPIVTASFNPSTVIVGGSTTFTYNVTNGQSDAPQYFKLNTSLPAGLEWDTTKPITPSSGCPGNTAFNSLGPKLTTDSLPLGAGGSCTVSATVKATSAANSPYQVDTGAIIWGNISVGPTAFNKDSVTSSSLIVNPVPTASSFVAPAVSYNAGSATSVEIDLSGHVTNASYVVVGSQTTAQGGSLDESGGTLIAGTKVHYKAPVGFRGNDSFQFKAVGADGSTSSAFATVTVHVDNPALTISLPAMSATAGVSYTNALSISGGRAPYSCAASSGALPNGLTLNGGDCTISGTPTATSTFNFSFDITDSSTGDSHFTQNSGPLTQTVSCPTTSEPPKIQSVTAGNGSATITFSGVPTDAYGCAQNTGGYTVTSNPDGKTQSGSGSPITVSGLTNGTAYTFTVKGSSSDASDVSQSVTPQGGQSITFTKPADQTYGTTPALHATSDSNLEVSFETTTTGVCLITQTGTLTFLKTGNCTIKASQAGGGAYTAAADVEQTFAVLPASQTITFNSTPPSPAYKGGSYTVEATASSSLAVTFSIDAASSGVCSISSDKVSFDEEGTCIVNADQAGDESFSAAGRVSQSLSISKKTAVLAITASINPVRVGQQVTFTATLTPADVPGTVSFTDEGAPLCPPVTISNGVATCSTSFNVLDAHTIAAASNGEGNYLSAVNSMQITVKAPVTDVAAVTKAIGGFISDRANQIVTNQADFGGHGIDRLNEVQGQSGGSSSSGFDDPSKSDLPVSGFGLGGKPMAGGGGMIIPSSAALASQGSNGMQDLYGLQAMLRGAMQNAGQSGSMDRFTYSGAFDATVNAHEGFAASFHTSLSQIMKWEDKALGVNSSHGSGSHDHSPFDLWVEGTYAGYSGERSGQFGLFTIGSDYVINPDMLIGVFTQIDTMNQTSGTGVSGTGWMAGPYATVRLTDQMFLNARAGWGKSGNSLSGSGDFTSSRWLASTELVGKWKLGQGVTFAPNLGFTYFADYTDSYVDTFGVTIPGVKTELGQLKLSPQLAYGFATDSGLWVKPSVAPELIWNFASTNVDGLGALSETATGPYGLRGRIKAGLNFRTPQGVAISASGSYDGIGSDGYSAIAAQAQVNVPLN